MAEHRAYIAGVIGSNPILPTRGEVFRMAKEPLSKSGAALRLVGSSPTLSAMLNFITNNQIAFIFSAVFVLLILWNILLNFKIARIKKRLKIFFNGSKASDLEGILFEEIKRLKKAENSISELSKAVNNLDKITQKTIQKVGVIRFNPFKETGGDQSFAIALLDAENNGLIISSLFTREGTRVYTKPIESGESKYPLSKEEIEALKKAGI